jgi:guanylate kinase
MGGKARKERPKIKVKTEWQKIESSRRFPRCNGIYDDCPPKEELEKYLKSKNSEDLPEVCRKCPFFLQKR